MPQQKGSSAGNTRGLIEAEVKTVPNFPNYSCVFRGEYPRPH